MDFKKKVFVDKQREKRVKHIIITITVLTMLPATLLTYLLVRENVFTTKANNFISQVITSGRTQVIAKEVNYRNREIRIVTLGEEISEKGVERAQDLLENFGLTDTKLTIVQGTKNLSASELKSMLNDPALKAADKNAQLLANERQRADGLERQLDYYREMERKTKAVSSEMAALYPEVAGVSIARTVSYTVGDTLRKDSVIMVYMTLNKKLSAENRNRMEEWIEARLKTSAIRLVTEQASENKKK